MNGPAAGVLATVAVWQVMMTAMMVPVALPWVRAFASLARPAPGSDGAGGALLSGSYVGLFAGGYFVVWLVFGAAGASLQLALGAVTGAAGATVLSSVLPIVAGAYQLTPAKAACLRHCRSPLSFLLTRWDDGPRSALALGVGHGAYCAACCWALMALALAFGVMSLAWMAALTALIAAENLTPAGPRLGRVAGWILLAGGVTRGAWLLVVGL